MGQIHHRAIANVPVEQAFAYVDDYRTVPKWMFGITKFAPVGTRTQGLGATYDAAMQIGPKSLGSRVRITEWEENVVIRLESVDGIANGSTWRFTPHGADKTELTVDFDYSLGGGLLGKALAKIVEPIVGTAIKHTEATLRAQVEALTEKHSA
ncbi:SRPBCC family protein [Rhodococcus spelaei]|uniref:SRPBCC family protein n=1 Tax=Rhodococcus spelaei TaxID=2546320 RepID=A0A541B8S1_9NOCA|nr:SRPBCC family protein [Rhodococcus spelaei]TQF68719.1 SRPBCC family protein [Rhodococcus spelaei]